MNGNILVTFTDNFGEATSYCLVNGKKELADLLLHYDDDKFLLRDIELLGGHIDSPQGVIKVQDFIKTKPGLEFGKGAK